MPCGSSSQRQSHWSVPPARASCARASSERNRAPRAGGTSSTAADYAKESSSRGPHRLRRCSHFRPRSRAGENRRGSSDYPRAVAMLDRAIVRVLPAVPKSLVRRISGRYIAGTTLSDAVRVVRELNAQGKMATIDVLGEETRTRRETLDIVRAYHDVFEAIERERLDSNVSVKLTALGLNLAYELCRANLLRVVRHAAESGNFVRIDMEDSSTTSDTLELYRELRAEGLENVGIVLQAYMRRTMRDIHAIAPLRPNGRLCKGIYVEPPLIAYRDYEEVRENFIRCLRELLQGGSYVGIATHDELLLIEGKRLVAEHGLTCD